MHYYCVVIVLFNAALCRSASFRKLVAHLSVLSLNKDIKICVIVLCNFDMFLFSPYTKLTFSINNKLFTKVFYSIKDTHREKAP